MVGIIDFNIFISTTTLSTIQSNLEAYLDDIEETLKGLIAGLY